MMLCKFFFRIRLHINYSLIFFSIGGLPGCSENTGKIAVVREHDRASGIYIPETLTGALSGPLQSRITVKLVSDQEPATMLGNYSRTADGILFEPLVPLTPGLKYEVLMDDQRIGEVSVEVDNNLAAAELLAIYPSTDTLPENLLKFYFQFSSPMREGQALRYISLLHNGDTAKGVFLDLQTELWNEDRTRLTLWLDPGRIKRDLNPNRKLGAPLMKGERYVLTVSEQWKDTHGSSLKKVYQKEFVAEERDSLPPEIQTWTIQAPNANTTDNLIVKCKASLDYGLLTSAIRIVSENGDAFPGEWKCGAGERSVIFYPDDEWKPGKYELTVDTRLEDLAGNNINRPFDRDVRATVSKDYGESVSLPFSIQ